MLFRKSPAISWLVVFLGNPGKKYEKSRHNVGFMTAETLAKELGVKICKLKFSALTAVCSLGGESALLMMPQTYMNLSGNAVREAANFYKIPPDHILVVSDDISLPAGTLRIRRSGSSGGHNGLKDIIAKCGSDGFPRIKIGVGIPPNPEYDTIDWVLGSPKGADAEAVANAIRTASEAIPIIIEKGAEFAMNRFN